MNLNKVILVGNITRDPELKVLPSGSSVCNFSIATNKTWVDKNTGQKQQATEYHNIVVFGKMADTIAQYMSKGSQILVEGRLQTQSWEAKDGTGKRYKTEIVAESFQFGQNQNKNNQPQDQGPSQETTEQQDPYAPRQDEEEINIEDIPF